MKVALENLLSPPNSIDKTERSCHVKPLMMPCLKQYLQLPWFSPAPFGCSTPLQSLACTQIVGANLSELLVLKVHQLGTHGFWRQGPHAGSKQCKCKYRNVVPHEPARYLEAGTCLLAACSGVHHRTLVEFDHKFFDVQRSSSSTLCCRSPLLSLLFRPLMKSRQSNEKTSTACLSSLTRCSLRMTVDDGNSHCTTRRNQNRALMYQLRWCSYF